MHQGLKHLRLIALLSCLGIIVAIHAHGQLNSSEDIIETIEDIQIHDDSNNVKKEENPNKPKYDEEFRKEETGSFEEDAYSDEEMIAEPESQKAETQSVEKKDLNQKKEQSYEDELEKNADQNKLERREIFPEDSKNFEVDQALQEQAEEAPAPIVESPKRETPKAEDDLKSEIEEEVTAMPEEQGKPIEYTPEATGPVIVYENEKKLSKEQLRYLSERTKVEIEEDPYVEGSLTKKVGEYLKSFKERRPEWTSQFELSAGQYEPLNYMSDIINPHGFYEDYYKTDAPMPTLSYEFKRNFSFGAIAVGGGASYYSASSLTSDLTLTIPTAKVALYLDTLFDEPYLVPYASFGYAYVMYNESETGGLEYSGASDNFFVTLGIQFQLDWLDPVSDRSAYEMGLENTYIFAEVKSFLDKGIIGIEDSDGAVPDFSTPFSIAAGLRLEF